MWAIIDPTRVTFLPPLDDGLGSFEYEHIASWEGMQTRVIPANSSLETIEAGEVTAYVTDQYPDYAIVLVGIGWREDPEARRLGAYNEDDEPLVRYLKRFW